MAGSASPSAPPPAHEDTPPPLYSEVVPCPPPPPDHDQDQGSPRRRGYSCKTPVLVSGILITLGLVIVLGSFVGDLWVRLDTLQVESSQKSLYLVIMSIACNVSWFRTCIMTLQTVKLEISWRLLSHKLYRQFATLLASRDSLSVEILVINHIMMSVYICWLKTLLVKHDKEITISQ